MIKRIVEHLLVLVLGPLLIKGTHRCMRTPKLAPFDLDSAQLPQPILQRLGDYLSQLHALGFEPTGAARMPDATPNVSAVVFTLQHSTADDEAMVAMIYQSPPGEATTLKSLYTEFLTRFNDGSSTYINNSEVTNAFPTPSGCISLYLPEVQDLAHLYQIHRAMVRRRPQKDIRRLVRNVPAESRLIEAWQQSLNRHVRQGILTVDDRNDVYVPTLRGAFILAWRSVWPGSSLVRWAMRRRAARCTAELGLS